MRNEQTNNFNNLKRRGKLVHYGNTGCGVFKQGIQN